MRIEEYHPDIYPNLFNFTFQICSVLDMKNFYFLIKLWEIVRLGSIILTVSITNENIIAVKELQEMFSKVMETIEAPNRLQLIICVSCAGPLRSVDRRLEWSVCSCSSVLIAFQTSTKTMLLKPRCNTSLPSTKLVFASVQQTIFNIDALFIVPFNGLRSDFLDWVEWMSAWGIYILFSSYT